MPKQLELEPIAKAPFPEDLRRFPDVGAMEMYAYRAVRRGPARIFYKEYEDSLRAKIGKERAAFRVHDVVLFFAKAAADGIIGNLAYAALSAIINRIRRPRKEIGGKQARFEAVVSRRTYNRIRRENHPERRHLANHR